MIIMIKSLECWAGRYPAHSWQRLYVAKSGDYGEPPSCNIWGYQTVSRENPKHIHLTHHPAAFKILTCVASLKSKIQECTAAGGSATHRDLVSCNDSRRPPWSWLSQLVWLCIVSVSKLGLFFFLLAFRQGFDDWGHFLFKPLRGHPQAELVRQLHGSCYHLTIQPMDHHDSHATHDQVTIQPIDTCPQAELVRRAPFLNDAMCTYWGGVQRFSLLG